MKFSIRLLLISAALIAAMLACQTSANLPVEILEPTFAAEAVNQSPVDNPVPTLVEPISQIVEPLPPVDLITSQDTLIQLYGKVNPGVVALRVLNPSGGSLGSGFVIDKEGHIITNYHVVSQQTELEVDFPTGFKTRGEVIGLDPDSDLAVLRVNVPAEQLHPLPLGDSDQVQVGQMVVAIGNPFGLEGTMTVGIVSGLGRTVSSQRTGSAGSAFTVGDVIQTDAAINPGNSGGPLLNLNGEVVGVNESILTGDNSRSNSGVGFAISVNMLKRVVPSMIANGSHDYPYLGIFSKGELSLLEQEALGLPQSTGVYITQVEPGGPADRAGIKAGDRNSNIPGVPAGGDLIIAVDGQTVLEFNDLIVYITKYKEPGDTVLLTIIRGEGQIELDLTLAERPN